MAEIWETVKTDAALVKAYVEEHDEAAFDEIARRHGPMVYRICRGLLKDAHEAEDCAQAAFVVFMRKARSLRREPNLAAWFYGVARHVSLRAAEARVRRAKHQEGVAMARDEDRRAVETSATSDLMELVYRELGRLSKNERQAVVLRYLEGRSEKEAAAIANCPQGTLSRRAGNGLARLRRRLTECGQTATLSSFIALLETSNQLPVPETLFSVTLTTSKLAAADTAGNAVHCLAKGVLRMMIWAKVKTAAMACAAVFLLGFGGPFLFYAMSQEERKEAQTAGEKDKAQPAPSNSEGFRKEKDFAGREWTLTDWKEGERPYKKNLAEREAEYRKKWGEDWAGAQARAGRGQGLFSPGKWAWEDVVVLQGARRATPGQKSGVPGWQEGAQATVFAPGDEVTAIYADTTYGIYHVDPVTKETVLAGVDWKDLKYRYGENATIIWDEPEPEPIKDGLDGQARLRPGRNQFGQWMTVDPITGRLFFSQGEKIRERDGRGFVRSMRDFRLRYVEKLLPYKLGGREMLLPAILDHNEMYRKIGAEPVMADGKRPKPRLAVRTTPIKDFRMAGFGRGWGEKIAITPDGKAVLAGGTVGRGKVEIVEIDTGKVMGELKVEGELPKPYAADAHEAASGSEIDGRIYCCRHPGCGRGPGRLFCLDPNTGKITRLYDSLMAWPSLEQGGKQEQRAEYMKASVFQDGPADAVTLNFVTTCFQNQCPRTGAIVNGGWDGSGFRRYHDGFVTTLVDSNHSRGDILYGRPEWGEYVANFGSPQSNPDFAPDGSFYFVDKSGPREADRMKRIDTTKDGDILIVRVFRTDWPKEQPVNGYANQFVSPEKREELRLEYVKKFIADYEELSKIY